MLVVKLQDVREGWGWWLDVHVPYQPHDFNTAIQGYNSITELSIRPLSQSFSSNDVASV